MESIPIVMVGTIKTKMVVLDFHEVEVFIKSLSYKKHLHGNEKRVMHC